MPVGNRFRPREPLATRARAAGPHQLAANEGAWYWEDGTKSVFNHWHEGEPNNVRDYGGSLYDAECCISGWQDKEDDHW